MAIDYGLSLGFDTNDLLIALGITQFVGFPAAIAFGWLGERIGTRKGIFIGLAVYIAATVWGYFLDAVWEFYALAVTVGLVQGGVQALSRSLYSRLIPPRTARQSFSAFTTCWASLPRSSAQCWWAGLGVTDRQPAHGDFVDSHPLRRGAGSASISSMRSEARPRARALEGT